MNKNNWCRRSWSDALNSARKSIESLNSFLLGKVTENSAGTLRFGIYCICCYYHSIIRPFKCKIFAYDQAKNKSKKKTEIPGRKSWKNGIFHEKENQVQIRTGVARPIPGQSVSVTYLWTVKFITFQSIKWTFQSNQLQKKKWKSYTSLATPN